MSEESARRAHIDGMRITWAKEHDASELDRRAALQPTKDTTELQEFATKLIANQEDLPPGFQRAVDKHFWELAGKTAKEGGVMDDPRKLSEVERGVHFRSFMALCAFRYALGRMSYIVGMVCDEIRRELPRIDTSDIELMVNEIAEADERGGLGMVCDRREWFRLQGEIKEEMVKRGHKL